MSYSYITISREHGSGGRIIAEKVAQDLSIPLYDKKVIQMASETSGLSTDYIEGAESRNSSLLYSLYLSSKNPRVEDQIFIAQTKAIRQLAEQGEGVFLGNCSDYVLRECDNVLKVFLYAPMEEKIERMRSVYGEPEKANAAYLKKYDKKRAAYHNYYALDQEWGDYRNYHLMINSTIGIEESAKIILQAFLGKEL